MRSRQGFTSRIPSARPTGPVSRRRVDHREAVVETAKVCGVDPIAYLVAAATRAKRESGAPLLPGEFKAAG